MTVFAPAAPAADPRLAAFLDRNCEEVFHSVATPTAIWQADPFDVETIHAEARAAFERLLHRAGRVPPPPSGAVLVLQGEAGSGKTHLMRAFRTRAHSQGLGYCGYLQMTTEASNYARYMLVNLVEGLEQPYAPDGPSRTGLARLSAALLEQVPGLSGIGMDAFREGECDPTRLADDYADRLHALPKFRGCDLELLRVILHLERHEPQVRSRALMWLRCQQMRPQDRDWIGGAVPRTDDADPIILLRQLAKLTDAVHGVPLVLLVDQLEDVANQSAPVERFRKVVDAVTAFTDQVPNAVVVLACLEDYFKQHEGQLTRAKLDRLTRDPEPIRLVGTRTADEIRAMTARRLSHLYGAAEVEADPVDELYPFRDDHLAPLDGLRSRDVLDVLRRHHQDCLVVGRWVEPTADKAAPVPERKPDPAPPDNVLDGLWNDFHSSYETGVPDDEEDLVRLLADAVRAVSAELPDGCHVGCTLPGGRFAEVEIHRPGNAVDKLLVAVCNKAAQGGGLGRQLAEVEKRVGNFPVALVRTTDFPAGTKSQVAGQIGRLIKADGRRVVVANADLRRMLAFEAFRIRHGGRPDFATWQKAARPLGELDSLQKILKLSTLTAAKPAAAPTALPTPPPPQSPSEPAANVAQPAPATGLLRLGRTLSLAPTDVTCEPHDFIKHAAFLGGSGSGKTTAALNLIEQLLARGVPAVLVDRKGDLCRYADPAAWGGSAGKALRDRLDVAVFTPGEPNGRPLALPVVPPGFDQLPEADRERFAQYAAGALGSMIGFKTSDADKGQRAILAKAIETLAAVPGAAITVPALREVIANQDDALVSAIGGGYPGKYFDALAERLLTLALNNRQLLAGSESLDVDALLGTGPHVRPGRVRLSVVSTRFLGDPAKLDFWVSQLLVAVSRWCAKSPRPHLQGIFLFDEADIYLPATRKPATKEPMEDLLKRARSAGVGVFLATQSPGDFDYKCKENIATWLIGRVSQPQAIQKLQPLLAAAKGDTAGKLAGQATGEFTLVRESGVLAVRSVPSLVRTEQMGEEQIVALARSTRQAD